MTMQKDMMGRAVRDSFAKLDPRVQIQNPVMFLVWLSAVMTSVLAVASIFGVQDAGVPTYYVVAIAVISSPARKRRERTKRSGGIVPSFTPTRRAKATRCRGRGRSSRPP